MIGLDHYLFSSFKEYLDYKVCNKLSAYRETSVNLHVDSDHEIYGAQALKANSNQWVYDSSLGVQIPSASSFSGDWQDSKIDFTNSRVVYIGSTSDAAPTSIDITEKYFNSYITSSPDQELFLRLVSNRQPESLERDDLDREELFYYAPCYFLKMFRTYNEPLAYGGLDRSYFEINVSAFCIDEMELLSLSRVFRDMKGLSFYLLNKTPLNEFNDLKEPWDFGDVVDEMRGENQPLIHIEDCSFNPIKSDGTNNKLPSVYVGIGKFKVFLGRYPRI